jgi:F0F1-type ATP synthase delta subunit
MKKQAKKRYVISDKVFIRSTYSLNQNEIENLRQMFPIMQNKEIENIVDPALYAGVVITVGTKQIDLSLSGGLQNLKHFMYESS